jgi:salicylate hydroxylase
MGPDAHLVHYPIGGAGGRLNAVAVVDDKTLPADREAPVTADHLDAAFHDWNRDAREFLATAEGWMRWPLYTMPALPAFSRGPFALLGDAAHPILPFLASGAVMAIEDAAVIAQELARTPDDCPAAFERYQERRMPRIERLQEAVAKTGEIYHLHGPMRFARNLALAAIPRKALLARNDWLYGFRVDDASN